MSHIDNLVKLAEDWFEENHDRRHTPLFDKGLRKYAKLLERQAELKKGEINATS